MKRFLRINYILFKNAWIRDSKISGFVFVNIISQLFDLFVSFALIQVVFLKASSIGGWTVYQTLFLLGFTQLVSTVHNCWTKSGCNQFASDSVRTGDYDFYLMKPFDGMLLMSISKPRLYPLFKILFEVGLMVYVVRYIPNIALTNYIWFFILFLISLILFYLLKIITILPVFWTIRGWSLAVIMDKFTNMVKYPAGVYPKSLVFVLKTIFPILVVTYLPVEMLFFNPKVWDIIYTIAITGAFLILVRWLWRLGEKNYGSASS